MDGSKFIKYIFLYSFFLHLTRLAKHIYPFLLTKLYSGGEWNSQWAITNSTLEGAIKINAHYFEDGNVQLKINRPFKFDISVGSNADADAKTVFDLIRKTENELLKSLDDLYEKLPNEVFKTFRKKLPCKKIKYH